MLPFWTLQEFEIELEGSQTLRILCYEKCYNKTKMAKEDGESSDRLMGKGQVQVRPPCLCPPPDLYPLGALDNSAIPARGAPSQRPPGVLSCLSASV